MKTKTKFATQVFFILISFALTIKKSFAVGENCSNPLIVIPAESFPFQNYSVTNSDKSIWFRFVANDNIMRIFSSEKSVSSTSVANTIIAYSGTCSSLAVVSTGTYSNESNGVRELRLNGLIIGNTYWAKIIASSTNSIISLAFVNYPAISSNLANCSQPSGAINIQFNQNSTQVAGWTVILGQPTIVQNAYIIVNNNTALTINHPDGIIFRGCQFEMHAGSSLQITDDFTLTSNNGTPTHIFGCASLWDGIFVSGSEDIVVNGNTLIEDAISAFKFNNNNKFNLIIENAIFNKNLNDLVFTTTTVNGSVTVGSTINNSIFTSRNLPANPTVAQLKNSNQLATNALSAILPPLNNLRSRAGISLYDYMSTVNNSFIGKPSLGQGAANVFDNKDYGILIRRSNLIIQNNRFQYMKSPITGWEGYGIFAEGIGNVVNNFNLTIGGSSILASLYQPNSFYSCFTGIELHWYSSQSIVNNNFQGEVPLNGSNNSAFGGIALNPASNAIVNVKKNVVNDYVYPIKIKFESVPNSINAVNVDDNEVTRNVFINYPIEHTGIDLQSLIPISNVPANPISIKLNKVNFNNLTTPTYIGIKLSFLNVTTLIESNILNLAKPTGAAAGIQVYSSNKASIQSNTITGSFYPTSTAVINPNYTGIYLYQSKNCAIQCNTIRHAESSITIDGDCMPTTVSINTMGEGYDGLVLTNSGKIGQQGGPGGLSDNAWLSTGLGFIRSWTLTNNSFGGLSPLYVDANAPYNPTSHNVNIQGITSLLFAINTTSGMHPDCLGGGGGGSSMIAESTTKEDLIELVNGESAYPVLEEETAWLNKKYAFEKLNFDTAFTSIEDSILNSFNDSASYENIGKVAITEQLMKEEEYQIANSINANIQPDNVIETNKKIFNGYYSLYALNTEREWTENEINELKFVANQCPTTGSPAVVQSRMFLDLITQKEGIYIDDCPMVQSENSRMKQKSNQGGTVLVDENSGLIVYPNPAKSNITLEVMGSDKLKEIEIYNSEGRVVFSNELNEFTFIINTENFSRGLYIIRCNLSSGKIRFNKLNITQ